MDMNFVLQRPSTCTFAAVSWGDGKYAEARTLLIHFENLGWIKSTYFLHEGLERSVGTLGTIIRVEKLQICTIKGIFLVTRDYLYDDNTQTEDICLGGYQALDGVFWCHIATATKYKSTRFCGCKRKEAKKQRK